MGSDSQNREVEKIAGELQASIRKAGVARVAGSRPGQVGIPIDEADGPIEHELAVMRANYDIASAPFTSHRPALGRLVITAKNIVREFIVQLLQRQSVYNGAAARAINHLKQRLDFLEEEQAGIARRIAALESRIGAGHPLEPSGQPLPSGSLEPDDGPGLGTLENRLDTVEKAVDRSWRTGNRS